LRHYLCVWNRSYHPTETRRAELIAMQKEIRSPVDRITI